MTLTGDVLEYISDYPYCRIEYLEAFFDEFSKSQLLQAVSSLNKRGKIEWASSKRIVKTTGADMVESGWIIKSDTLSRKGN